MLFDGAFACSNSEDHLLVSLRRKVVYARSQIKNLFESIKFVKTKFTEFWTVNRELDAVSEPPVSNSTLC